MFGPCFAMYVRSAHSSIAMSSLLTRELVALL